jgi:hypothetical protein
MQRLIFTCEIFFYENLCVWTLFCANLSTYGPNTLNHQLHDVMTFLGAMIHSNLWSKCSEFVMPQLSWVKWQGHKWTPPYVHFSMISCIVWCKWTSVPSKGVMELMEYTNEYLHVGIITMTHLKDTQDLIPNLAIMTTCQTKTHTKPRTQPCNTCMSTLKHKLHLGPKLAILACQL